MTSTAGMATAGSQSASRGSETLQDGVSRFYEWWQAKLCGMTISCVCGPPFVQCYGEDITPDDPGSISAVSVEGVEQPADDLSKAPAATPAVSSSTGRQSASRSSLPSRRAPGGKASSAERSPREKPLGRANQDRPIWREVLQEHEVNQCADKLARKQPGTRSIGLASGKDSPRSAQGMGLHDAMDKYEPDASGDTTMRDRTQGVKIKPESDARASAADAAWIRAAEEARVKAASEARVWAEEERKAYAVKDTKIRIEGEAKAKAVEEARVNAEEDARNNAAVEARIKAVAEHTAGTAAAETKLNTDCEAAALKAKEQSTTKRADAQQIRPEEMAGGTADSTKSNAMGEVDTLKAKGDTSTNANTELDIRTEEINNKAEVPEEVAAANQVEIAKTLAESTPPEADCAANQAEEARILAESAAEEARIVAEEEAARLKAQEDAWAQAAEDARIQDIKCRVEVTCHTQPGETVILCGANSALGNWDVSRAVRLETSTETFPMWFGEVSDVPAGTECKLVIVNADNTQTWESIHGNRLWPQSSAHGMWVCLTYGDADATKVVQRNCKDIAASNIRGGEGSLAHAGAEQAAAKSSNPKPVQASLHTGRSGYRSGGSIAMRAKMYEEACRTSAQDAKANSNVCNPGQASTKSSPTKVWSPPKASQQLDGPKADYKLKNVVEQRILKNGLIRLSDVLASDRSVDLVLPKRPDGTPVVLQSHSFLKRLLDNQIELKSCMEADVCAAQSDLRHLLVDQLLTIRVRALDFATESETHSARLSFLQTVDKYLFSKFATHCLRGDGIRPEKLSVLHELGFRMALILGVKDALAQAASAPRTDNCPPLPQVWVIKLPKADWPDTCEVALFHTGELWVCPLLGEELDFTEFQLYPTLAVVRDRTTGIGKDRILHWEVVVLPTNRDEVLAELRRQDDSAQQSELTQDLSAALARRSSSALGLDT